MTEKEVMNVMDDSVVEIDEFQELLAEFDSE